MQRVIDKSILVEGNISVGKSLLLSQINQNTSINHSLVKTFTEPLNQWKDIEGVNLFGLFNRNPSQYAFAFESYIQLTLAQRQKQSEKFTGRLRINERSIYSSRMVFIENMYRNSYLNFPEYLVLNKWFEFIEQEYNDKNLDLIVYLKASPENLIERIQKRNRPEEKSMTLEYLYQIDNLYEEWLGNEKDSKTFTPVYTIDTNKELNETIQSFNDFCILLKEKYHI